MRLINVMIAMLLIMCGCFNNQYTLKDYEELGKRHAEETKIAMQSWMGHDINELIAGWGPPQQTMDDGQGGKIFVYIQNQQINLGGSSMTLPIVKSNPYMVGPITTIHDPGQTINLTDYKMFWINQYGKVYHWSWKNK